MVARLRNYFLTGLVVVGPVTITIYIAWYVINIVDRWVKPYIPHIYNPDTYLPFAVPGIGLVFAILMLTMIGALAANLLVLHLLVSLGVGKVLAQAIAIVLVALGAKVEIRTRAIEKFVKRERRYVRHEVEVTDVESGVCYFREVRDIMSL